MRLTKRTCIYLITLMRLLQRYLLMAGSAEMNVIHIRKETPIRIVKLTSATSLYLQLTGWIAQSRSAIN